VGPALFERGGEPVNSWLDGDGYATAISFSGGRAHVRSRFVQTKEFVEEERMDKFLYR
jgi:all-trans-8'-apo-beta-carotenal 15,15'-oxygenase